jgi:hypothetical protein
VMPAVLFLDDDPVRWDFFRHNHPHAVWVQTAADAIAQLSAQAWDMVCLDHDLGGEYFVDSSRTDCGMEVVRHLVATKPPIALVVVHSLNEAGATPMVDALRQAGYQVRPIPFVWLEEPSALQPPLD